MRVVETVRALALWHSCYGVGNKRDSTDETATAVPAHICDVSKLTV